MISNVSRVLLVATLVLSGCISPRPMYEGKKRPSEEIAVLILNLDSGARVVAVDSTRALGATVVGIPPSFTGKMAVLPGRHTLDLFFQSRRWTDQVGPKEMPQMTTFVSTNLKRVTFDARAGHTYKIEAECSPVDYPPGALTWRAWIVEDGSGSVEVRGARGNVEIVYLGLLREFIGAGLGGMLLTGAIARAFEMGARRVWVHTCTLDDPRALAFYQSQGLRLYDEVESYVDLPD